MIDNPPTTLFRNAACQHERYGTYRATRQGYRYCFTNDTGGRIPAAGEPDADGASYLMNIHIQRHRPPRVNSHPAQRRI
jgi:hypothetical protein